MLSVIITEYRSRGCKAIFAQTPQRRLEFLYNMIEKDMDYAYLAECGDKPQYWRLGVIQHV